MTKALRVINVTDSGARPTDRQVHERDEAAADRERLAASEIGHDRNGFCTGYSAVSQMAAAGPQIIPSGCWGTSMGRRSWGSAEIHDGPISLLGDVFHIPVSTNITTRNVLFQGGKAELQANSGTALVCCTASSNRRPSSRIWGPASELGDLERIWN
jgi:hypothetical protein